MNRPLSPKEQDRKVFEKLQITKAIPSKFKSSNGSNYRLKKNEDGKYFIQYKKTFLFLFYYWRNLLQYRIYGGSWLKTFDTEQEAIEFIKIQMAIQKSDLERKIKYKKEKYVKYL